SRWARKAKSIFFRPLAAADSRDKVEHSQRSSYGPPLPPGTDWDSSFMAEVLNWQDCPNQQAIIDSAVQALNQGQLVVFPTDIGYCIAASVLVPEAVDRLARLKSSESTALTLALAGDDQALDWAPQMSPLAKRLARRCWPGPVTLVVNEGVACGLASQLAES